VKEIDFCYNAEMYNKNQEGLFFTDILT